MDDKITMIFKRGINMENPAEVFLRAENPIALVRGERTLSDIGLHNGTTLFFER